MNMIVKLDTRGRLVIPNEFRAPLGLKEGDEVLLSLDFKTDTVTISPVCGDPKSLVKLDIEFGDEPGCLAKIAEMLADMTFDLIMTESKSSRRGRKARWEIVADISRTTLTMSEAKQKLLQSGYAESVSFVRIARGGVHG
jgi:AbrB family looped-hinge helix DNA binding protein